MDSLSDLVSNNFVPRMATYIPFCMSSEDLINCTLASKVVPYESKILEGLFKLSASEDLIITKKDRMKKLMGSVLQLIQEPIHFHRKPYTLSIEFRFLEVIVMKTMMATKLAATFFVSIDDFKMLYPTFASLHASEDMKDQMEFHKLYQFRNCLAFGFFLYLSSSSKHRMVTLVTKLIEGSEVYYASGGRMSKSSKARHLIFDIMSQGQEQHATMEWWNNQFAKFYVAKSKTRISARAKRKDRADGDSTAGVNEAETSDDEPMLGDLSDEEEEKPPRRRGRPAGSLNLPKLRLSSS